MNRNLILIPFLVIALVTLACGININLPGTQVVTGPAVVDKIDVPNLDNTSLPAEITLSVGAGELKLSAGTAYIYRAGGTDVPVTDGGTGASTAADARTNLGLVNGTDVQAYDADWTTWAGVTPGTGIATALAVNVGSAGAPVLFNVAGGTPSSITLMNASGLPDSALTSNVPLKNSAATITGAWRWTPAGDTPRFDGAIRVLGLAATAGTITLSADQSANAADIAIISMADGGPFTISTNNGGITPICALRTGHRSFRINV